MVLVIMLSALGFKLYKVVTYSMEIPSEVLVKKGEKSKNINIRLKGKAIDKASFNIISNKDLFRPSRSASLTAVSTTLKSGSTNYPKLFATIVIGNDSIAIIEDPLTKKTKSYHLNEVVSEFLIKEILEDRVILLLGEEKIEIKLRDDKGIITSRPKPMVKQRVKRTTPVRRVPARRRLVPNSN